MHFSSIPALGALFAVASANLYTTDIAVVCSGADPTTIYQTITVTAPYHAITNAASSGGNSNYVASMPSPYVTTVGKTVTSVEYSGSQTSVWVYPTGSSSHDCTVAIYEKTTIINVIIVNINITIINGETKTVTSIVTDAHPTFTPIMPPMHNWNTTSSTKSMPTNIGYHNSTTKPTSSPTSMHMGTVISSKPTTTSSSSMHMNTGVSSKSTTSSSTSMHMGTATTSSSSKPTSSPTTSSTSKSTSAPYGTGNVGYITYTGGPTLSVHATPSPVATSSAAPKGRRAEAWFA